MTERVVIVNASAFGRETLDIFNAINKSHERHIWDVIGFIDDNPEFIGKTINKVPHLGNMDWLIENYDSSYFVINAIGNNFTRKKTTIRLKDAGCEFCNAIHPNAILTEFIDFGIGIIITAGTVFTNIIEVGNHVKVNLCATIGHDAVLEDYSTLAPGVHVNGCNHIREGVYLGTGAACIQNITIGEWTTIGAGAAVVMDIPAYSIAVGVPAKVIKKLDPQDFIV